MWGGLVHILLLHHVLKHLFWESRSMPFHQDSGHACNEFQGSMIAIFYDPALSRAEASLKQNELSELHCTQNKPVCTSVLTSAQCYLLKSFFVVWTMHNSELVQCCIKRCVAFTYENWVCYTATSVVVSSDHLGLVCSWTEVTYGQVMQKEWVIGRGFVLQKPAHDSLLPRLCFRQRDGHLENVKN